MKKFYEKRPITMLIVSLISGLIGGVLSCRITCIKGIECKHVLDIIFLLLGLGAFFVVVWGHHKAWYEKTICCWLIAATVLLIISGITYNIAKATLPFTKLSFGNVFCIDFQEELESQFSVCSKDLCLPEGSCSDCQPFLSYFPVNYRDKVKHILDTPTELDSTGLEKFREDVACTQKLCDAVNLVKRFRREKMNAISLTTVDSSNKKMMDNEEKIKNDLLSVLIVDTAVLKTLSELSKQDCKSCR